MARDVLDNEHYQMCLGRQADAQDGDCRLAATAWLPAPTARGDEPS
jgi:hypothetical protein